MMMWGTPPRMIRDEAFIADNSVTAGMPLVHSATASLAVYGQHHSIVNITGRVMMPARPFALAVAAIVSATNSAVSPDLGFSLDSDGIWPIASNTLYVLDDLVLPQRITIVAHLAVLVTHAALSAQITWDKILADLKASSPDDFSALRVPLDTSFPALWAPSSVASAQVS